MTYHSGGGDGAVTAAHLDHDRDAAHRARETARVLLAPEAA